jgi:hypothetical protein
VLERAVADWLWSQEWLEVQGRVEQIVLISIGISRVHDQALPQNLAGNHGIGQHTAQAYRLGIEVVIKYIS